jgi:hypothetical protein
MIRFPWSRRPVAAAPRPALELVQDGAGELAIAGQAAYSFDLRPALETPARLVEVLPIDALVRQLEAGS